LYAFLRLESMAGSAKAEVDSNGVEGQESAIEIPENDDFA